MILDHHLVKKSKRNSFCNVSTYSQGVKNRKNNQKIKKTVYSETMDYFIKCLPGQGRRNIVDNGLDMSQNLGLQTRVIESVYEKLQCDHDHLICSHAKSIRLEMISYAIGKFDF